MFLNEPVETEPIQLDAINSNFPVNDARTVNKALEIISQQVRDFTTKFFVKASFNKMETSSNEKQPHYFSQEDKPVSVFKQNMSESQIYLNHSSLCVHVNNHFFSEKWFALFVETFLDVYKHMKRAILEIKNKSERQREVVKEYLKLLSEN